jgi:hypothetical protein
MDAVSEMNVIRQRLDGARRRARRTAVCRHACQAAAAAVAALALYFAMDMSLDPTARTRWMLMAVMTVAICAFSGKRLAARVRLEDDVVALRVEALHPELGGGLIAAVQCGTGDAAADRGSPAIIAEIVRRASHGAAAIDFGEIVNRRPMRRAAWSAGAALAAAALFLAFGGAWRDAFLRRIAGGAVNYPTRTVILRDTLRGEGSGGDPLWTLEGGAYSIVFTARGRLPAEGEIIVRNESGVEESRAATLDRIEPGLGIYRAVLGGNFQDFKWRARLGDDATEFSEPVRIEARPRAVACDITFTYPAYTLLPPETRSAWEARAVTGTEALLRIRASKPLRAARIVLNGEPMEMEIAGQTPGPSPDRAKTGAEAAARFPIARSGEYRVEMTDELGLASEPSAPFPVTAVDDRPPAVDMQSPAGDAALAHGAVIPMRFTATDDVGVAAVRLLCRRVSAPGAILGQSGKTTGQGAERIDLPLPGPAAGRKEVSGEVMLRAADIFSGTQTRQVISLEAEDWKGARTESRRVTLTLRSDAELLYDLMERRESAMRELADVRNAEREIAARIVRAGEAAEEGPARAAIQALELDQDRIARRTLIIAERLSALAAEFERNGVGGKEPAEFFGIAVPGAHAAAETLMPEAASALRAARQAPPDGREPALRRASDAAHRVLAQLDRMLGPGDRRRALVAAAFQLSKTRDDQQTASEMAAVLIGRMTAGNVTPEAAQGAAAVARQGQAAVRRSLEEIERDLASLAGTLEDGKAAAAVRAAQSALGVDRSSIGLENKESRARKAMQEAEAALAPVEKAAAARPHQRAAEQALAEASEALAGALGGKEGIERQVLLQMLADLLQGQQSLLASLKGLDAPDAARALSEREGLLIQQMAGVNAGLLVKAKDGDPLADACAEAQAAMERAAGAMGNSDKENQQAAQQMDRAVQALLHARKRLAEQSAPETGAESPPGTAAEPAQTTGKAGEPSIGNGAAEGSSAWRVRWRERGGASDARTGREMPVDYAAMLRRYADMVGRP